ncbi:MAG TPA: PAS domain S-box protein, partial [Rhodanobacteraceae bacterium]|nr:PAS domain S-box protein [Rhodanobacteraceae bacterium]
MLPASAFRFSPSLVAVLDAADGTIVDVNPTFERLLGVSRAEAIGKRTVELNVWPHPETRAAIWMRIRSEQHVRGDLVTMRSRDGRVVNGRLYAELFEDAGRSYALAIIQDIAEGDGAAQRASEQAAIDSYRALFDATVEGIYRSFPEGGFIDVNPALAQMFGFASPAEMLAAPARNPEEWYVDPAQARELFEQLDREGRVVNAISRVYRRDGSTMWISENMRAIRNADGRIAFYEGTAVDITEARREQEAIAAAEHKYRSLFQNAVTGMFQSHPDGRLLE